MFFSFRETLNEMSIANLTNTKAQM